MEKSPQNVMYSFKRESLYWPLLIVAGLLLAAVQSHHSVAFTPHILAYYPLSRVAGTSPKKCHSFCQLHSVEIKRHASESISPSVTKKVLISVTINVFIFFLSSSTLSRWFPALSCLQKLSQLLSWFRSHCFVSQENNWSFYTCVFSYVFHQLIM